MAVPVRRFRAAMALCILVVGGLPTGAAEPWLQHGHDPAMTGWSLDPGPAYFGHAFTLQLPGARGVSAPPIIMDGTAFVLTRELAARSDLNVNALYAIDLDTAVFTQVLRWDAPPQGLASDGTTLYVVHPDRVEAVAVDGAAIWSTPIPHALALPASSPVGRDCVPPTLHDGVLYVGCTEWPEETVADESLPPVVIIPPDPFARTEVSVFAIGAADGRVEWQWSTVKERNEDVTTDPGDADLHPSRWLTSMAVAKDRVLLAMVGGNPETGWESVVWALGHAGSFAWQYGLDTNVDLTRAYNNVPSPSFVIDTDVAYLLVQNGLLIAVDLEHGKATGRRQLAPAVSSYSVPNEATPFSGHRLALVHDLLIVGHGHTLQAFDRAEAREVLEGADVRWSSDVGELDYPADVVSAAGLVYVVGTARAAQGLVLRAVDLGDGGLMERPVGRGVMNDDPVCQDVPVAPCQVPAENNPGLHGPSWFRMGVGEGSLVVARRDGTVMVFGDSPASVQFHLGSPSIYPPPGEVFTVDVVQASPGAFGSQVTYRVSWGDGFSDRASSGTLTHRYRDAGEYVVEVWAENEAGQQARRTMTVQVGGTPPTDEPEQSLLKVAFAQYPDTTWGIIGLLIVLVSAIVTVYTVHHRRSILRQELQALEDAAREVGDDDIGLDRAMAERRRHVRHLLLEGKVDEAQFAILDGRITELVRDGRLGMLEERLPFLPFGMAQTLRKMLMDGHINAWEHETVLKLLDQEDFLTKAQKAKVVKQLEAWRAQDAG